nr:MAG TPA: hypothetical protein [Caudoviricetes sp.]
MIYATSGPDEASATAYLFKKVFGHFPQKWAKTRRNVAIPTKSPGPLCVTNWAKSGPKVGSHIVIITLHNGNVGIATKSGTSPHPPQRSH